MNIEDLLKKTGLWEREAKIYLSCIKFHSSPASKIADDIKNNRTTTYHTLLDMCKQWYIHKVKKNNTHYFSAISPDELIQRHENNLKSLKEKLPELYSLYEAYNIKSRVNFYEWVESVKHAYLDKLNHWKNIYVFLWVNWINPQLKKFMYSEYIKTKLKKNITSHVILKKTSENQKFIVPDQKENRKSLLIDDPLLNLDCEIDLYWENRIAIITWSDQIVSCIIIENQNIYNALKSFFDLIWKNYSNK